MKQELVIRGDVLSHKTQVVVLGEPDKDGHRPETDVSEFITRVEWDANVGDVAVAKLHCVFTTGEMPAVLQELVADFYARPSGRLFRLKVRLERLTWRGRMIRRRYVSLPRTVNDEGRRALP